MAEKPQYRIVFMGTPAFAADILRALLEAAFCDVVLVYTMPDRPAGRGAKLRKPPVKVLAEERGLPVRQPENFRDHQVTDQLATLHPDFLVVAAYGLILPQAVLDVPKIAPVNVHASILPAFRGAAPIQRAIMSGTGPDACTGVSLMRMEKGMDTGPVYACRSLPIGRHDTGSLTSEMATIGAKLLIESLPLIASGSLSPLAQDENRATYAPKIEKSEARLDFDRPCAEVDAMVRALAPSPGARCAFEAATDGGANCRTFQLTIAGGRPAGNDAGVDAGSFYRRGSRLFVGCADGFYEIECLKPAGKREMTAADFLHGHNFPDGRFAKALGRFPDEIR